MPIEFALTETGRPFAYQAIAKEALALRRLGMSAAAIARALGVTDKTVSKTTRRARRDASTPSPPSHLNHSAAFLLPQPERWRIVAATERRESLTCRLGPRSQQSRVRGDGDE